MTQPHGPRSQALVSSLAGQRHHVLGILEGLSEENLRRPGTALRLDLRRAGPQSGERRRAVWLRAVVAGELMPDDEPDNAWQDPAAITAAAVLDGYRQEIERADAIIAATSLDSAPAWWPEDLFGSWRLDDMREILLQVIAETATHAGHLDAARELIDGGQWIVVTE